MNVPKALVANAIRLAHEIDADGILFSTENDWNYLPLLEQGLTYGPQEKKPKLVVATSNPEAYERLRKIHGIDVIKLTTRLEKGEDQIKHAIAFGTRKGIFVPGQKLICLVGEGSPPDALLIREVMGFEGTFDAVESNPVLSATIEFAIGLGRGGPNSKPIGASFMIGSYREVMKRSHQLMINPFKGYSLMITDRGNWQTIKRYAVLDGAFIVGERGKMVAAARHLDVSARVDIPRGLGSRHLAVAAMTAVTRCWGVTTSGEDGTVRMFKRGKLEARIDPVSRVLERSGNPTKGF